MVIAYRAYPISASSWSIRTTASSRRLPASRSWVRATSTGITSTGSVVSTQCHEGGPQVVEQQVQLADGQSPQAPLLAVQD